MTEDIEVSGEEPKPKTLASRQRARAAVPAFFVDTWAILRWSGHLRIVLGESLYGESNYRAAVVMELDEAERFALHILERVAEQRVVEKKAQQTGETIFPTDGQEPDAPV